MEKKITYEEFDEDGYLYDKMSNFEEIERIVGSTEASEALIKLIKEHRGINESLDPEKFKSLMKIPNKELLIPKGDHPHIWKQIFSIAFGYIY